MVLFGLIVFSVVFFGLLLLAVHRCKVENMTFGEKLFWVCLGWLLAAGISDDRHDR